MLPKDPILLLGVINLKLRDYYSSFEALCDDMDVDGAQIKEILAKADYHYNAETNQFG